jgi:SAM-dependent methyltransferase
MSSTDVPSLFHECNRRDAFIQYYQHGPIAELQRYQDSLVGRPLPFEVPGECAVCQRPQQFSVDAAYASRDPSGRLVPNWRERLICAGCGLNNRMRASIEFIRWMGLNPVDPIYVTEQVTTLFRAIASRFPLAVGSEYLRDGTPPGQINAANVRCEDVTRLSFPRSCLAGICSFDVLEHVPAYRRALSEFARVLRPDGCVILSIPFDANADQTLVRARSGPDGRIEHLMEPEYHGDPLSPEGALCFYHFGWSLLEDLHTAGFERARVVAYASREKAYLGGPQLFVTARKPSG